MRRRRVLIVEDDPIVALDLEAIVVGAADAEVAVTNSVRDACRVISDETFDAALLDIDVVDGKTFDVAHLLAARGTPFAFVSGSRREELPPPLRQVPFLPKPYDPQEIERSFLATVMRAG